MKPIPIHIRNCADIEAALAAVNGKSTAHAFTTFEAVETLAGEAEAALVALGLPKTTRPGAFWHQTSGAKVSNSYKGTRNGTYVELVRRPSGWFLAEVRAVRLYNCGGGSGRLSLSADQRDDAVRRFELAFDTMY